MSDALLVMVHGSPRPVANEDMFRVVEQFRRRPDAAARFPIVEVGFMECNEPSIPEAIDRCVGGGAATVTAVPYFLHTGTHVCDDLPTLLEEARERHPHVTFRMGDYLGLSPKLTSLLAARADEAVLSQTS
ncbi:MAG: CbiX/SirB N-terminal domain-containing protein [Cytophagales bacterium]|nr:CbiX/SirB N-terminal domain-containing protein [Armatimonadota bacterium]